MNEASQTHPLDADAALSLVQLLGPDPAALEHIADCERCRALMLAWETVERAVAEAPVRAGFADEVLEALGPPTQRPSWPWAGLNAALSFVAAGLALAWLEALPSPGMTVLLAGLAAAAGLAASARRRPA